MNFNTTASDNDRYCREKYIPERPVNLNDDKGGAHKSTSGILP
jgi:hypothetical protein